MGLAFDGDGDRVGLITNKGDFVLSDHIIMMLAEYYLKQTKGPVVFDVKCCDELGKMIEQNGGEPIMEKTGHFNIKNTIKILMPSWVEKCQDISLSIMNGMGLTMQFFQEQCYLK